MHIQIVSRRELELELEEWKSQQTKIKLTHLSATKKRKKNRKKNGNLK